MHIIERLPQPQLCKVLRNLKTSANLQIYLLAQRGDLKFRIVYFTLPAVSLFTEMQESLVPHFSTAFLKVVRHEIVDLQNVNHLLTFDVYTFPFAHIDTFVTLFAITTIFCLSHISLMLA